MKIYKNRILDFILKDALEAKDAVLIEGAKWCGKTTTAEQIAKSVVYMNDPKRQTYGNGSFRMVAYATDVPVRKS